MKAMRRLLVTVLICATAVAWDAPKGTVPRSAPDKYSAHAEENGVGIGATRLSASQAKKVFSTDVDRCCLVVEVALYPQKDGLTEVSLDDFALRIAGQDIATRPSGPELVAARLQKPLQPKSDSPDVVISQTSGIGYTTGGVDPVTGQRRPGGVITTAGAGVGVGVGGSRQPTPVAADTDRRTMELELSEKSLPQGNTSTPVSGYLYFNLAQKKNAKYQLEYMLDGKKVVLALP
ncbi:MAG TPA: hypothetical protein VI488_12905 [Candidatus Angelobacter sp.]